MRELSPQHHTAVVDAAIPVNVYLGAHRGNVFCVGRTVETESFAAAQQTVEIVMKVMVKTTAGSLRGVTRPDVVGLWDQCYSYKKHTYNTHTTHAHTHTHTHTHTRNR
jgi:hypothetical protein